MNRTIQLLLILGSLSSVTLSAFPYENRKPDVVREAERREERRQNETWTPENIRAHPDLFLKDAISACDALNVKIESQNIAFLRLKKQAERNVSESESAIKRYSKFLNEAKTQYKKAQKDDSWPVVINGFELTQEELEEKIADALERVDMAKTSSKTNTTIIKKIKIRQGVLKSKSRELVLIRRKLVLQAEQVKMNQALGEIDELTGILGTIKDMSIELSEDPTKFSLEDITEGDPDGERKKSLEEFLED